MAIKFESVKGTLKKAIGGIAGEARVVVTKIAGPASYTTGGFDVTVGELGEVMAAGFLDTGGYGAKIDYTNSNKNTVRVVVYQTDTGTGAPTEVPAGTDLSGVDFVIIAFGW